MIKYEDWEIEGMDSKKARKLGIERPGDYTGADEPLHERAKFGGSDPCRVVELELTDDSIRKVNSILKNKYFDYLKEISEKPNKNTPELQNGLGYLRQLREDAPTFLEDLQRIYTGALRLKDKRSSSIDKEHLSASCRVAVEQYYVSVENINRFILNMDKMTPTDPDGYRAVLNKDYVPEIAAKVYVYPRKLKNHEKWGPQGKTGKWVREKIEDMKSTDTVVMSEMGMKRVVDHQHNDNELMVVFASNDLSTYYLMGGISAGKFREMKLVPERNGKKEDLIYKIWMDELTTLPRSVTYTKVITKL